jgi:ABC-type nickel/cobalt efflux system permease component RcnA
MKNPFKQEDNSALWISASIAGALAAAAGIWFYLRGKRAAEEEARRHEHAQDYLKDKKMHKKKHKTDVHELEDLIQHPQA